ncbi:carbohydrate ABC transporter permease [Paenibacillus flagellatus]|uniref:ABC transporter permease n=1 Tax=Paenibacillus flagellatus TaxID=2211139 RepID=A0A2V5K2D7_9BACL|nr:carbohydrate ABC transporter permease [Paenibacillus flagellatus]PYI53369.1 ABC transporter permease [Paenibacillus flagellatus]
MRRPDGFQIALLALMTLLAVVMALPIVYIFNHAFKPYHELFAYPPTFWVRSPTLDNWHDLLAAAQQSFVPFTRYLFNSVLVAAVMVAATVLISSMGAYPLSKHKFKGKKLLFSAIVLSLMFAPEAVGIPRYLVVSELGLMNRFLGHIVPNLAMPVGVFLMKQFMDQVPDELIEAAKLDGAREFAIFARIVMPVCMPAVATISILTFQATWGDAGPSSLYMQDETLKTLPFYIDTLTNGLANSVAGQGRAAMATMLMFLVNFIIFLTLQKKVIDTMAHSGIK